jgi:hypothetical protein
LWDGPQGGLGATAARGAATVGDCRFTLVGYSGRRTRLVERWSGDRFRQREPIRFPRFEASPPNDDPRQSGKSRLRLQEDDDGKTSRTIRRGIRAFAEGCFAAIRNPVAHDGSDVSETEALERLAALEHPRAVDRSSETADVGALSRRTRLNQSDKQSGRQGPSCTACTAPCPRAATAPTPTRSDPPPRSKILRPLAD